MPDDALKHLMATAAGRHRDYAELVEAARGVSALVKEGEAERPGYYTLRSEDFHARILALRAALARIDGEGVDRTVETPGSPSRLDTLEAEFRQLDERVSELETRADREDTYQAEQRERGN